MADRDVVDRLGNIEKLLETLVSIFVKAEQECPESLRRNTMYYHDMFHIKVANESIGLQMDPVMASEMERVHHHLVEIIEEHRTQGGAFHGQIKDLQSRGKLRKELG